VIPNKETEKFKQNPQISQQMKPNPDAKTTNLHKYKKEIRRVYNLIKPYITPFPYFEHALCHDPNPHAYPPLLFNYY